MASNCLAISRLLHAQDRAVQEDVLAARQFRVEACADFEQAADAPVQVYLAGRRFRDAAERILSSVLLPAPLRPMMPTTSPFLMSNSTSLSAQKVSFSVF